MGAAVGADRAALSEGRGAGRPPIGLERMLRIYFLQQWFNLSDPAVEEALYDSHAMRDFVGIDLGREPVPDETHGLQFRHLLERTSWGADARQGERPSGGEGLQGDDRHDRRCDDHRRAVLDQEPGRAARPGDAPDQEGQSVVLRDEGAYRGGQHDQADPRGGGHGGQCRRQHCCPICCMAKRRGCGATRPIAARPSDPRTGAQGPGLHQSPLSPSGMVDEVERRKNRTKSKVRAKVEHAIRVIKRVFGFAKVRYRGLPRTPIACSSPARSPICSWCDDGC